MDSTGVEEDPLGRFESERFTSAARSMSGKPPEMHRGSVRAESGSGPVSRSHVAESQMRIGNSWVGTLESVVATRKFCIEYRGQGTGEVARACANCRQEAFTTKVRRGTKESSTLSFALKKAGDRFPSDGRRDRLRGRCASRALRSPGKLPWRRLSQLSRRRRRGQVPSG